MVPGWVFVHLSPNLPQMFTEPWGPRSILQVGGGVGQFFGGRSWHKRKNLQVSDVQMLVSLLLYWYTRQLSCIILFIYACFCTTEVSVKESNLKTASIGIWRPWKPAKIQLAVWWHETATLSSYHGNISLIMVWKCLRAAKMVLNEKVRELTIIS